MENAAADPSMGIEASALAGHHVSDRAAERRPVASDSQVALWSSLAAWCVARRYALVVWSAMVLWSAALFATARADYVGFRLGRFDLGNMVQAVWSTAHGRPLEVTNVVGDEVSRLSIHVDPILALFAPFWLVVPSPLTIILARIVVVALGALPVFWIARRNLASERIAALFALAYLAYPWLAWTALAPHPLALSLPLLLYCVWALDADRLALFVPFAVLATLTGELMGLTLALLGIWYAFSRRRRRAGLVVAALAVTWTAVAVYLVVPSFAGSTSTYYGYFASVGRSPQGVVRTLVSDPGTIASALFTPRDSLYLAALAVPVGCLFLLAPGLAAAALPQLLANALAGPSAMTDPRQHYSATLIAVAVAATVIGASRLSEAHQALSAKVVLVVCVALSVLVGAWPGTPVRDARESEQTPAHLAALRAAVALVPADAPLSSTDKVGSQLSARRHYYSVPVLGRAQWVVLDTHDPSVATAVFPVLATSPRTLRRFTVKMELDPAWHRVYAEEGVLVFRKRSVDMETRG